MTNHNNRHFRIKAIAALMILLSLLATFGEAEATTVTVRITLGQGKLKWNGQDPGHGCKCTPQGDNCKITITISSVAHVSDGGTVWTFDGNIPSAIAVISPGDSAQFDATIPGANLPLPDGSYLDVPDDAFPGVPGFHIPLDNIVCDADGNFSGSIPK